GRAPRRDLHCVGRTPNVGILVGQPLEHLPCFVHMRALAVDHPLIALKTTAAAALRPLWLHHGAVLKAVAHDLGIVDAYADMLDLKSQLARGKKPTLDVVTATRHHPVID